jgi:hypothetical protein
MAGLRSLGDVFWSRPDELEAALTSARRQAGSVHRAALERCADLAESRLAASALAPRATDAAAAIAAVLARGAAELRGRGEETLAALASGSLGSARPRTLRARATRRLGRDARRSCRDRAVAGRLSRRLAAECGTALATATDEFVAQAGRSAAGLAREIAGRHASLIAFRAGRLALCPDLVPAPSGPAAPSLPAGGPAVEQAIAAAAAGSVRPLTANDGRWLRLRTVNSVRADLGLAVGRPGFAADRTAVADGCARAWRRLVDRWSNEAVAVLDSADYREFLTALDALPKAWQRTLERHEAAACTDAADAAALLALLDQAASALSAARRAWDAIHADLDGDLSVATRAYLHAIAVTAPAAAGPGLLRSDLDDLSRGEPELRIPVVAPMKAGKSTLLSALLGLDIAPRRAQIMTAVPTRFIPVPPARQAEPRLELPESVVAGHRSLLDAIAATITDGRLAALAAHPHLQSAASRLQRGDRVPVTASHTGPREIRSVLTWLHDTARLATVLPLPTELTDVIADWRPEVTVPVLGAPTAGRLALVDIPGPGEAAAAPVFAAIMNRQLADAHGCLIVIDFAQMLGTAEAALARLIGGYAAGYQPSAVAIAVNRIDQRRDGDLDGDQVVRIVRQLFGLAAWAGVPVFETAASLALAAQMYRRTPDPANRAELLRIAYPVRPPARVPSERDLEDITQTVLGTSGVTELRGRLFDQVGRALPRLAMEHALARAAAPASGGQGAAISDLIADARWAARLSARITHPEGR